MSEIDTNEYIKKLEAEFKVFMDAHVEQLKLEHKVFMKEMRKQLYWIALLIVIAVVYAHYIPAIEARLLTK